MPKEYFPRVKEAREALKAKALEIYELQVKIIMESLTAGDFETAAKANQWLLEHMPNEDGVTVIDSSAATPKQAEGHAGPSINIGFALGGVNTPKALPQAVEVIDITPEPVEPVKDVDEL